MSQLYLKMDRQTVQDKALTIGKANKAQSKEFQYSIDYIRET